MSTAETQNGFPRINAEFVNEDRTINQVWLRLLITMWNRTGGGQGASTVEALIYAITNQILNDSGSGSGSSGGGGSAALSELGQIPAPATDPLYGMLFELPTPSQPQIKVPLYAPAVTGETPGPVLLANTDGTCIMTQVDCVLDNC